MMYEATTITSEAKIDRISKKRRGLSDHHEYEAQCSGEERRKTSRRKNERRRQIDPTTCERDYTDDEIEFMKAMDTYKRSSGREFPTWSEVLEVVSSLGYRKVAEPTEIVL